MGNFLDGIQYPLLAGMFGIIGAVLCIPLAGLGLIWPAIFSWLWVPPVAGIVIGLIVASYVR